MLIIEDKFSKDQKKKRRSTVQTLKSNLTAPTSKTTKFNTCVRKTASQRRKTKRKRNKNGMPIRKT